MYTLITSDETDVDERPVSRKYATRRGAVGAAKKFMARATCCNARVTVFNEHGWTEYEQTTRWTKDKAKEDVVKAAEGVAQNIVDSIREGREWRSLTAAIKDHADYIRESYGVSFRSVSKLVREYLKGQVFAR
jgi:galactokinase